MSHIPFDDDESDGGRDGRGSGAKLNDAALQLSDGEEGASAGRSKNDVSGLEDDSTGTPGSKRTREEEQPKKRRKRRKVVLDNNKTELSNDHIRNMLKDTSDIVRRMVHPASVWEGDGRTNGAALKPKKPWTPPVLTRPFLEDPEYTRGGPKLHPRLKALWRGNFYLALDEPCPFKLRKDADDIEKARRAAKDDEEQASIQSDMEMPQPDDDREAGKKQPGFEDDFDMPQPDDEEEDEEPDEGGPPIDFDDEEEMRPGDDDLDLGLVNEMELDEEEEDRQALGEVSSSTAKWHQHTVKVLKHLQRSMRDPDAAKTDGKDALVDLPDHLKFQEMTKKVTSRRNAASVFFELLQLKTWDFIDVDQEDEYGDITIAPGVRFGEAPPSS